MENKALLLEAIAGKNRGLLITEKDKVNILTLTEKLEDENPTPQPLKAIDLLNGNWRLLYTNSKYILGLNNFPLLQLGEVYQCIRSENSQIYNIAEIVGIPYLEGLVSVAAIFEAVSDKRVNVNFIRSIFGLQRFVGYLSPSEFITQIENDKKFFPFDFPIKNNEQKGWLEITYLDHNLRISRGNEGNIFILSKS